MKSVSLANGLGGPIDLLDWPGVVQYALLMKSFSLADGLDGPIDWLEHLPGDVKYVRLMEHHFFNLQSPNRVVGTAFVQP